MTEDTASHEEEIRPNAIGGIVKKAPTRERSEEKHNRPPEPASDAVLTVTRPAGKIVNANAAAAEMLGYSLPELIGLLIPREIVAPEVLEQTQRECVSQVRENGHYCVDTIWVRKDGSRIPVKASGKRITLAGRPLLHLIARDIREREGAEEALKESEERLKVLFEFAPDAYYLNDLRGIFVDGNTAAEEITGYKREELIGKSFLTLQLLPPGEIPKAAAVLAKNVAGQPTGPDEFTLNRKDGSQVRVEIRTFPVRINSQTLVLGIARDVTERKQAEEALRKAHGELEIRMKERTAELTSVNERLQHELTERKQAEEALRLQSEMMKNMAEAVYLIRASDGMIVYTNPAFERLFGYGSGEMVGKHVSLVNAPTVRNPEETAKEIMATLDRTGVWRGEILNIKKDGTHFWCYANVSTFDHREHGSVWVTYHTDITERKQAEEALRASKALLEKTFASLKEAVFVVDPNTRSVIACNSTAERMFGYREKEMLGRNTEFLHVNPASYANFGQQLFSALNENGVFHTEYQVRRKNGDIFLSDHTVTEIVDDAGRRTGLVSVVRDITDRKRMEEALQAARDELEGKVERQLLRRNPYGLTFRELTVLHLVAAGKSDKEIAVELGISPYTAQKHTSNILAKMGAGSRTEATARALREGLLH